MIDLLKITKNNRALFLAYDQGFEHGPAEFNDKNIDPEYILNIGVKCGFNAIILHRGVAEKYYLGTSFQKNLPLILKLNGKTNLSENEPLSLQVCSVSEAVELGAAAVGYTVYVGSRHEPKMLQEFGKIVEEAHRYNLPVIGWMYPRGGNINPDDPKTIAYAARVGLEIGADMVKVKYGGDLLTTKRIVEAAGKCKVIVAGGIKTEENAFLETARIVIKAGAAGIAVGRNIWQSKNPEILAEKLKKIIFDV